MPGMGYGFGFDPTYVLVMIGAAIAGWASMHVQSTFAKYNQWETAARTTGREMAQQILQQSLINDVALEHVAGHLTDHYDSRSKVLRLSDATDRVTSIAAVAVAAHECGHAIQDAENYGALRLRSALAPITQLGSTVSFPLIMMGLLMGWMGLVQIGVIAFGIVLIFQLVTLPVEFDASRRALAILEKYQLVTAEELPAARKVLNAAALTYVAGALSTALQLLRFILIANSRRRD